MSSQRLVCRQRLAADYALWPKLFTRSLAEANFQTVPEQANAYALQQNWKQAYSTLVVSSCRAMHISVAAQSVLNPGGAPYMISPQQTTAVQLHFRFQKQTSLKVRYLEGHEGAVICLAACGNIIASGSTDQVRHFPCGQK